MNPPNANMQPSAPAEGETLQVSGIDQWTDDQRTIAALKGLAEAKAPQTVAQMVLWYVTTRADWDDVGRLSKGWGNASEIALARRFVANLGEERKPSSQTKIINDSPLILNGVAIDGTKAARDHAPSVLAGLSLPPLKTLTVPATVDAVKRLGLKEGARVVATDLSGL